VKAKGRKARQKGEKKGGKMEKAQSQREKSLEEQCAESGGRREGEEVCVDKERSRDVVSTQASSILWTHQAPECLGQHYR
jgi:hypothetical protein